MGDSDTENEAFVQNVKDELSAFYVDEKAKPPDETTPQEKTVDSSNDKSLPDKTVNAIEPGSNPPKSRIIRLSRPANPFSSRSLPSVPSSSSGTSSTASVSSLRTTASPAPGSRLAALSRPGSPMHKILQRSQSPALAGLGARMSKQASDSSQPSDVTNTTAAPSESNAQSATDTNISTDGDTDVATDSGSSKTIGDTTDTTHSANQTRSVLPPRIQSSSRGSGSILLRRPQSPLRSGKSQLLIHKQISVETNSQAPNSPLSATSPRSPQAEVQDGDNQNNSSAEAEKAAIRNKLRANSFRLKDLLTQRPFTKRRDTTENTSKDDSATSPVESGTESQLKGSMGDNSCAESESSKVGVTARSRWRTEASSLAITGTRSKISERTSSLISARSFRTRTPLSSERHSTEIASDDGKPVDNSNSPLSNMTSNVTDIPGLEANQVKNGLPLSTEPIVSVGATLLRSPRTRIASTRSNVPLNSQEPVESNPENTKISDRIDVSKSNVSYRDNVSDKGIVSDRSDVSERNNVNDRDNVSVKGNVNERSDVCDRNDAVDEMEKSLSVHAEGDKRVKAISDLEKETEANLVFNSERIGILQEPGLNPPDNDKRNSEAKSLTQSMYVDPVCKIVEPAPQGHVGSVPTTPVYGMSSMRTSKSYDNTPEADFLNSSTALKRSFAVTDLDKAMVDRDQQKLNLIFKDENKASVGDKETPAPLTDDTSKETDIDSPHVPGQRMARSPLRHRKIAWSMDDKTSSPTPLSGPPPVGAVAPMVYKPNVNMEDAIKWPIDIPGKLDFRKMEVFEGQMLLNWLTGSIDKAHYLRLVMTKHDICVIACQICTCLLAAGVIKQLESKDHEAVFKSDCMYFWTHTQTTKSPVTQDVNKLAPMWPPEQGESPEKPGLKYTEADHQAAMVTLRHEYKQEVDSMQSDHQGVLDRARHEYEARLQQAVQRIVLLQQEVEKYKNLAGLEQLSQKALSEADAARLEAGLPPDDLLGFANGFHTPMSDSSSVSQYHTPAMTPDGLPAGTVLNNGLKPSDIYEEGSVTSEQSQDNPEGEGSEAECVPVPPPPPPPPPPGSVPPPPPLPGSMFQKKVSLKPVVNPTSPMKPLFWQRIQVHELKAPKNKEMLEKKLVWEEIEEEKIDMLELDQLFSKINTEHSKRFSFNKPKSKSKEVAKVIAPKRSQVVGILLSSLRIEMSDIEHAILNFDTSLISEEKLRQIYECRCDDDELKKLKEHIKKHPDVPLDKPDQFLYDISLIPDYAERIFCFIFREAFQDSISVIETKLSNLRLTCQNLMSSVHLKKILGLVLAMGNYMNGGSKRGQADGFGIDILPKLKDVKSKDTSVNLLYYTVQQYIKKYEKSDAGTDRVKLPLPDPSDLNQGTQVNFTEIEKELKRIKIDFAAARKRADKVMQLAKEHFHLQPFKDVMLAFFERGEQQYLEQVESLEDGKKVFQETVIFFCVKPRSGEKEVIPEYFFSLWSSFCQDFKDTWKREQQRIIKTKIKENEMKVKRMQENLAKKPVRTRTRKAGGLKDRMAKKGLLES